MEEKGKEYANPHPTPNPTKKALAIPTKPNSNNAALTPSNIHTPIKIISISITTTIIIDEGV